MTQQFVTTFIAVFLAELGDKTQIATLSFAANPTYNRWLVLLGACAALCLISFMAVVVGSTAGELINPRYLKIISGLLFIGIGLFTLWS
ncbi:MAG TPA: TMEM165/GDT1 family protein [Candidatus Binatia bacterium]